MRKQNKNREENERAKPFAAHWEVAKKFDLKDLNLVEIKFPDP